MEMSDSRKRPLDADADTSEFGVSKKSNPGLPEAYSDCIYLKVLVPSVAAGAIIGKGGETISEIQKAARATIKMSKANDFYPGTTERVCLITGPLEGIKEVHNFIMEKIREKPDLQGKVTEGENKAQFERHKLVKILVPNTTAGRIIGKNGAQVREIKDMSGAYIQLSQKSKEMNLPERCITIAGDVDICRKAVDMVLEKIMTDPQSGSCPNISYSEYKGPVASANPTGSPFASGQSGHDFRPPPNAFNNLGTGINNLKLNSGMNAMAPSAVDTMRISLRG